jgi:hypothetical protein
MARKRRILDEKYIHNFGRKILEGDQSEQRYSYGFVILKSFLRSTIWSRILCSFGVYRLFVSGLSVVCLLVCLPLDPRFAGSNLAKVDGFLRAIKILPSEGK